MQHLSSTKMSRASRAAFSVLAVVAIAIGAYMSPAFTSTASANNGLTVSAVPNSGTLIPGQSLEIRVADSSGTTDAVSDSCLVNNVDVNSTFHNAGPGDYRYTYTVGAGDASRAAGTIPIDCTIHQAVSIHMTAFDDSNTVAIDTTGTTTGNGAPSFPSVSFAPSSGTIHAGMGLSVNLPEASGKTDVAVTGPCTVNGVDVSSGFSNNGGGSYSISYIVGASDTERAAGTVPISCVLGDAGGNVTISSVAANTLAIDTNDDGTIGSGTTTGATLPSFSSVTLSPSSGTLVAGNTATVTFNEAASQTDLAVTGSCMVNAVDVAPSFHSTGGGQYVATYTVASGDGERPAGHIPFTCTLGNSAGDVSVHGWSDGNTLAIDTNGDGTIDNGTSTLGFTVSADPSTGMLDVGDQLVVSMQDPLPSGDVVIGSNGCRVNDVDVAPTYTYMGNGLYRVTYTVAAGNALRPAGGIPFDCTLQNSTGSVHLVAFTDGNTVGVNETTGGGGGTGTTTGTSTLSFAVSAVPMSGTIDAGHDLEVYMNESSHDLHIALDGACTVNGVDVSSSFQNLTDGLYKVIYHVGSTDTARAAGTVPISCSVHDTETGDATVISAFTDSNTVAIGGTTGGGTGTTTGGTIGGDVTGGGSASSTVALHVDSIEQIRDTATAGGGYANGWVWVFHITVPTDETSLAMKFDDWTRNGGGDSIAAADDMRISSDQAASTSPVSITAAGTYSTDLSLTGDTDPSTPGRQIEVKVEMQVPSDTMNGTYTTAYGVRSM